MRRITISLLAMIGVTLGAGNAWATQGTGIDVETVSTRAELVTGGDVLLRVTVSDGVSLEGVSVRVNGRDVTDQLTVGRNGVAGSVAPLLEGSNTLRLEVFGRSWWGGRYYQDSYDIVLDARAPLSMDRA